MRLRCNKAPIQPSLAYLGGVFEYLLYNTSRTSHNADVYEDVYIFLQRLKTREIHTFAIICFALLSLAFTYLFTAQIPFELSVCATNCYQQLASQPVPRTHPSPSLLKRNGRDSENNVAFRDDELSYCFSLTPR